MENLEFNPFFNALQEKYIEEFERAQDKGYTVFIPLSHSLANVVINKEFVAAHLAKPSPCFQGEYEVCAGPLTKNIRVESNIVQRSAEFGDTSEVRIVGAESGYSDGGKRFNIYVIDKPLQTFGTLGACDDRVQEISVSPTWLDGSQCPNSSQCKTFISSFGSGKIINDLDKKLNILLKNYLFLSDYLTEIAEKLRKLVDSTIEIIVSMEAQLGPKTITVLPVCIEGYVMSCVHSVLFPIISRKFQEEDENLSKKLLKLHRADVTPSQLGALELFSCPNPASVVELARLPSLTTPREQLQCVKNTIDLISAEIKQHLLESRGFLTRPDGLPCVTTDDLIPALSTTIIKSKLSHLSANNYYMETFSWSFTSKDVYGYTLASFKAAIEFLKSFETQQLLPSNTNLKKELSLEELMEVTGKLDDVGRKEASVTPSAVGGSIPSNSNNPLDRQMEKIAKMIEASTRELSQVQHQGFHRY